MKRNIVIAVVTAAALVGGGTATALAMSGDDDAPASRSADARVTDDDAPASRSADARVTDDDGGRDDDRGREDADDAVDADDRDAQVSSGDVTAAEAIAAALKHTPGKAVSAELDHEDDAGKALWEVDVLGKSGTWHSVRVDPAGGKVLSAHQDDEDDAAEVRAALKNASVSAEEAAKAASAKGTVTSVDLDDDGDKGWEVETAGAGEWRVGLDNAQVTADRDDSGHDDGDDGDDD